MNKNKYIIFNKDQITKKDIVYCRGGKSPEDIMKYGLPSKTYYKRWTYEIIIS